MPKTSTTAPLRVEVLVNGRRVAVAGVDSFGVISAIVTSARRNPADVTEKMRSDEEFDEAHFLRDICELELAGLDAVADKHVFWAREPLQPGREVTIRILPAGAFDAPQRSNGDA